MTLFTVAIGYSQTVGDYFADVFITYKITSLTPNEVEIIGYDATNGGTTVNIPDTVINGGNSYIVTSIGDNSFASKGLIFVTFTHPSNVTNIGQVAFTNNALTSITIPNSVISIDYAAFGVNGLTSVIIPDSVTNLGDSAFDSNALTSVTISNNLTSLGNTVFAFNNLSSITIPNNITMIGAGTFNNNPLTCVISQATIPPVIVSGGNDPFGGNRSNIDLSIPSGTASAYATAQWTGFKSVAEGLTGTFVVDYITYQILPTPNNEVTITGYNTAGGTVVNIPTSVTSGCTDFSVTEIGASAFYNKGLTDISIPNGVVIIGAHAIRGNNLTSITIPDSVTSIDTNAFRSSQLSSVTLSNNLIYIGVEAFAFNDLNSVVIPDSVITIDDGAFVQNNNMTNLVIGNSVTNIGEYVFRFTALTTVTIPASVTNIGVITFGNPFITDVYCEGLVPPTIATTGAPNTDTFDVYRSNIHLHIPAGTMGAYVTDAGALWTGFNPVTEDALGVSDFELANDITVITTTDAINITHSNSIRLENYTIYSVSGAKVTTGKENNIDTNYLSSGIYILKLDFNKGTVIKKFVAN